MNTEKFYANLSKQSYSKKNERDNYVDGFTLDTELSDSRHAVYHNKDSNHTIISVRGTNTDMSLDSVEDLSADAALAFGNLTATRRYKQAQAKLYNTQRKYKNSRFDLTGHSLGGRVVEELASREEKVTQVHSYNPGSFVSDFGTDIKCAYSFDEQCQNRKKRVNRYTVDGDVLSMAAHTGKGIKKHKHYNRPKRGMDAHTINNFI